MKAISVVIPLYNLEKYIERSIRSVLNQTVLPLEIIVVNDGSTDNSLEVVTQINHPLVRVINQSNQGVAAARNNGIKESKGEYIAFLDGDDEWMVNHISTIEALIGKYPTCGLYATAYLYRKEGTSKTIQPCINQKYLFRDTDGLIEDYYGLVAKSKNAPLHVDAVVVKKSILVDTGGFPIGITSGEDVYYWARLYASCDFVYSKEPTTYYNLEIYGKPPRFRPNNPADQLCDELLSIASHRKHIKWFVAYWYKNRMVCTILMRYYRMGLKMFLRAFCLEPLEKKIYVSLVKALYSACNQKEWINFN